jgi:outer membrane protein OmpA-like peptidoglycan-associated protein
MKRSAPAVSLVTALIVVLGASTVVACHPAEPTSPSVGLTKAVVAPKMPDEGRGASRSEKDVLYGGFVGDAIAHMCSGPAPFFEFDSTDPKKDQPTMQMLADCMIDGPLRGKTINLVGHTDPRGSVAYNDKLGLDRAGHVRSYLVAHGVAENRVRVATVGADEARTTPEDWKNDRRVEIQLVP